MLGDYKSDSSSELDEANWNSIQKLVIWPQVEELKFEKDLTKETYIQFCKDRFVELKRILLKEVGFSTEDQKVYYESLQR
jgi:hypothetical protein